MNKNTDFKARISENITPSIVAIVTIGLGVNLFLKTKAISTSSAIGVGLMIFGVIQFIRGIKSFHLTEQELVIRRPLLPFKSAEERFSLSKINEARFIKISGIFGGPHLSIYTNDRNGDYRIFLRKEEIDRFERALLDLEVNTTRKNM